MNKVLEQVAFNLSSLHDFSPEFVAANEKFALAVIKEFQAALQSNLPPLPAQALAGQATSVDDAALWKSIEVMFASSDECVFDDQAAFCILAPEFDEARESFEQLQSRIIAR